MDLIEELVGAGWEASAPAEVIPVFWDQERRLDRIRGMLFGGAVGDALGGPHEFRNQVPLSRYTGRVEHPIVLCRRFQGGRLVGNLGQITDDTEMVIALARSIIAAGAYSPEGAAMHYLAWANSKCYFVGNNTRHLFVGVKTYAGYRSRWQSLRAQPAAQWSQSNGCLMRCIPLAALPDDTWAAAVEEDCALTNFHPVCIDAVRAYVGAARELLVGKTPAEATARAIELAQTPDVAAVIVGASAQRPRIVDDGRKGWVLHALHCAFLALNSGRPEFQDRIDQVIRLGGDTDTNGAIAGALLGALYGARALAAEDRTGPNVEAVLAVDSLAGELPRPARYGARHLPAIAQMLAAL